jgi:hypothetical protein
MDMRARQRKVEKERQRNKNKVINLSAKRDYSPLTMKSKEFEVLTAVVMKNSSFWYITPCSSSKTNRRFGGTSSACYWLFLAWLMLQPRRWR